MAVSPDQTGISSGSLDGAPPVLIQKSDSWPIFAPPDALLYLRDGALVMRRFDPGSRRVLGEPVQLASDVNFVRQSGRIMASASEHVLAFNAGRQPEGEIVWISREGKPLGVIGEPGAYNGPQISPDQKLVAVSRTDQQTGMSDVWTTDLATGVMSRLTYEPAIAGDRVWSPDGQSMAFWTRRKGKTDFYQHTLGTREATVVYESPEDSKWLDDWGPGFLLFHRDNAVYRLPLTGDRTPQRIIQSPAAVDQVKISKDGRYLAYGSVASGRWEVYVAPIAAPDRHRQVSSQGGGQPRWRKDGRELYYITSDGVVMAVDVTPSAAPDAPPGVSAPKRLFQSPLERTNMTSDHYDVAADGSKFIFVQPLANAQRPSVTVVVNWK
jgi:Tol biopolymer transport system component